MGTVVKLPVSEDMLYRQIRRFLRDNRIVRGQVWKLFALLREMDLPNVSHAGPEAREIISAWIDRTYQ